MQGERRRRDVFLDVLRPLARTTAYGIALLLSAVWVTSATASFMQPLFDLGKARVGDSIIAFGGLLHLSPRAIFELAHMLVALKLLLGTYLLVVVIFAAYERLRWRRSGDEMLDIGLLAAAIASIIASGPLVIGGEGIRVLVGELMLCVIASGFATFARGSPMLEPATVIPISAMPISAEPAEVQRQAA
ncbi:MAG: hypothetical protein ACJ8D4_06095 [Xanthobacteraceae bacterium]